MLAAFALVAPTACERNQDASSARAAPPTVEVAKVVSRTVSRHAEFIASTESIRSVTLRARVTGFLQQRLFTEGSIVKEGDLLYLIDPSQYEADLRTAQGDLAIKQAALTQADLDLARYEALWRKKDVSEETYDSVVAKAKEAKAAVASSQAAVDQAQLNLGYTRVSAPLTGRIGDTLVNVGNLVGPSQNAELATIVQLDPIYVIFRPGGADLDAIVARQRKAPVKVAVTLSDGTRVPHTGEIDFIDNRIDPATGTLKMRAVIANPDGALLPGRFARIRVDLGSQPDALLVPQRALVEDQGGFLLYVVGSDGKVQVRKVEVGGTHGGSRVIKTGIGAGERVILSGVQLVHAGMKVQTKPAKASAAEAADQPARAPAGKTDS